MRIVGGTARGRRLLGPPKGLHLRPTSDKVREAIFDVLAAAKPGGLGASAIDLFAGTGALGIEALSRGAGHVVFVESASAAARILDENLRRAGYQDRATVRVEDAERAPRKLRAAGEGPFDIAFLDAPYGSPAGSRAAARLVSEGLIAPEGIVVLESGARDPLADPPGLETFRRKRYGDTSVAFLRQSDLPAKAGGNSEAAPEADSEAQP